MFGFNFTAAAIVALLIACGGLTLYVRIQSAEIELLEQKNQTLHDANEQNVRTIHEMLDFSKRQADLVAEYGERNETLHNQTLAISGELDSLRATEAQQALAAPFERGNAAAARRRAIILRMVAPGSGPGGDDPGDPPDRTTDRTQPPGTN